MQKCERAMSKSPNVRWFTLFPYNCMTAPSCHHWALVSPTADGLGGWICIWSLEKHWVQHLTPTGCMVTGSLAAGMEQRNALFPYSQAWVKSGRDAGHKLFGLCQASIACRAASELMCWSCHRRIFSAQPSSCAVQCFYLFAILFCLSKSMLLNIISFLTTWQLPGVW